jgi:hypothetical protein
MGTPIGWRRRAALGALLVLGSLGSGTAAAQALRLGQPAPDVAGTAWINGGPLTIRTLRGRVVLVEFWTYG